MYSKPSVKRLLRRPRRKCNDNIKADLNERGCETVVWSGQARLGTGTSGRVQLTEYSSFRFYKIRGIP